MTPTHTGQCPVGRFAPSPTGDLHFGSLLAALASYCEALSHNGRWQLRIDDIDGPRSVKGSADAIQRTLEAFGFQWHGPVIWQSSHLDRYHEALAKLARLQTVFACSCSRRSLPSGKVYPGNCRKNLISGSGPPYQVENHALRMCLQGKLQLHDAIQGIHSYDLARDIGDIIVWRRDGLVSYSLACAVDDAIDNAVDDAIDGALEGTAAGVTQVVRGADLLDSTGAQVAIMNKLGLSPPDYAHIPVAIDGNGDKLSKHSKAAPVSNAITQGRSVAVLLHAWHFLGQADFNPADLDEFWQHALVTWNMDAVPKQRVQHT